MLFAYICPSKELKMLMLRLFFCVSLFLAFVSCARVEGCMDPIAKNFDPEADKNCCCQYYQLRFDIDHSIDTFGTDFNLLNFYSDAAAAAYQIKSSALLISDISLVKADGTAFYISDSILTTQQNGGSSWLRDDFIYLKPGTFISNIGAFIHYGDYSKVRFLVGLSGVAAQSDGAVLNTSHPLSSSNAFYNAVNGSYRSGRWEIIKNVTDTIVYELSDTIWVELDYPLSCRDGFDTAVPLGFNYSTLMQDVVFATDDSLTVLQKFKNNIRHAFYIQ
jgi:hypothetical protein